MRAILNNWSMLRAFRLLFSIAALVQALVQKDLTIGFLAIFLLVTAITNIGCCGANGCTVNFKQSKKEKEIIYEELDAKK
ncbi:MAG: hypothetical protein ABIT58_10560 [Ferruginibacter sp.]